jgi:hypothetical protein
MAIMAMAGGDGKTFTPAPAGVHQAVCVDVVDLGLLDVTWQGVKKVQHKINVAWQINEDRDDGKPYLVFKRYTLSLGEKANLCKDLESWRGKKFTDAERKGFDVERLIGVNCLLNVTHNQSGDRTYANVVSIMPLAKGMPTITARDYVRKVDRQPETAPAPHHVADEEMGAPLVDDDIPFAWLLPLVWPMLGSLSLLA